MSTKKQPKKAIPKPASGEKPKKQNTVGKVVEAGKPAPEKKPNTRPDVKHTHEYLDSVKKEDIPSEGKRLSQELKTASDNKDYVRADQLKVAMAGLQDKGVKSGLKAADLVDFDIGTGRRISDAFEGAFGGNTARLQKGLSAAKSMTQPKPGDKPTPTPTPAPKPAPTPAPAKRGGWSEGKARNIKGKCGESLAKEDLIKDGYTDVMEVQNKSGHGVDLMGRNANGDVRVLEVKTTDGTTAPGLKGDQASMGGKGFTDSRLDRAANAKGHYKNSPEAIANGIKGQEWLKTLIIKSTMCSSKIRKKAA
jgi:hypothetical protein